MWRRQSGGAGSVGACVGGRGPKRSCRRRQLRPPLTPAALPQRPPPPPPGPSSPPRRPPAPPASPAPPVAGRPRRSAPLAPAPGSRSPPLRDPARPRPSPRSAARAARCRYRRSFERNSACSGQDAQPGGGGRAGGSDAWSRANAGRRRRRAAGPRSPPPAGPHRHAGHVRSDWPPLCPGPI